MAESSLHPSPRPDLCEGICRPRSYSRIRELSRLVMAAKVISVRECSSASPEAVTSTTEPAILRGADIGHAPTLWKDVAYLSKQCSGRQVRVHSSATPYMDFITKNFSYKLVRGILRCRWTTHTHAHTHRTMTFNEFLQRASQTPDGENPVRCLVNFGTEFT